MRSGLSVFASQASLLCVTGKGNSHFSMYTQHLSCGEVFLHAEPISHQQSPQNLKLKKKKK